MMGGSLGQRRDGAQTVISRIVNVRADHKIPHATSYRAFGGVAGVVP